jgi:predicted adenine nucleotide alpha hydrolase (AANH) superfamily ATPase
MSYWLISDYFDEDEDFFHICCAPARCIHYRLKEEGMEPIGFFFANIHPYLEYSNGVWIRSGNFPCVSGSICTSVTVTISMSISSNRREGRARCEQCYRMRLDAVCAAAKGFRVYTTSLLYSKYQKHDQIQGHRAGMASEHGIELYYEDFRRGWREGIVGPRPWGSIVSSTVGAFLANVTGIEGRRPGLSGSLAVYENYRVILFLSFIGLLSSPASLLWSAENIRVAVADNQKSVVFTSRSRLLIDGRPSKRDERRLTFRAASVGGRPARIRSSSGFTEVNGKSYRGWIELRKKRNGLLLVVNDLDVEDYLQGVIPSEIPSGWEPEALKAQAVASRTYASTRRGRMNRPILLASVKSQVYNGSSGNSRTGPGRAEQRAGHLRRENHPAFIMQTAAAIRKRCCLWNIDEPASGC